MITNSDQDKFFLISEIWQKLTLNDPNPDLKIYYYYEKLH